MAIQAIALDFDGLILDTETTNYLSFREVFKQYGYDMPLDIWSDWAGGIHTRTLACSYLESLLGTPVDRNEITGRQQRIFDQMILQQETLPGVIPLLQAGKRQGLKIVLASSASSEWAVGHLTRLGIRHYFDYLQTRDNVTHVKPHPEIYCRALEAVGVQAHEAIAFEDSLVGTLAAKAAGLACVAVTNPVTESFSFDHVDLKLGSLLEMELEQIILLVGKG